MPSAFEVLAQPIRRSIVDALRDGERLVGELADDLGHTQPQTSKHLRVLRDAGFVSVRVDGPRRWYGLRPEPLAELDDWLTPYRWMWENRLDDLGAHLDTMPDHMSDDTHDTPTTRTTPKETPVPADEFLTIDGRPTVRVERHYPHPIDKVWRAVTTSEHLRQLVPEPGRDRSAARGQHAVRSVHG